MQTTAILTKGSGYWDTTDYPLGGCFRRAIQDTTVPLTGQKHQGKLEFTFGDKRKGWSSVLLNPEGGTALPQ
jgi:hypothetical protein